MLFSESLYNHQVRADIAPYQTLFISLFFITLGMGLNMPFLAKNIWLILGATSGLILVKFTAIHIVARIRGASDKGAFLIALILAQGGEFGLLILQTMKSAKIEAIPFLHTEILTAIIIISMMMTPALLWLYDKLNSSGILYSPRTAQKYNLERPRQTPAVIICGFGRVGQTIAKMLALEKVPYVAVDMNTDRIISGREQGYNVFYGDTTRGNVLSEFGLAPRTAKAVIIALDNAAVAKKTVRAVRRVAPKVKIFARARNLQESKILIDEGARVALPETIESSFMLGRGVLSEIGIGERKINSTLEKMRRDNYSAIPQ
jgi:CPA2 family monovalent cation:H+ antiporter-2